MSYWLVKSEPNSYSIDDLARDKKTAWDGVRNYQARNYMRDQMKVGDQVLFYHSSTNPMAVVGVAEVASESYPDASALDAADHHYDPKATPENPIWALVDLAFVEKFKNPVTLKAAKADPQLEGMMLIKQGSRFSVQPVSKAHFKRIIEMTQL
ncbi:MAG: EVE domain-containing protein [bacterium]